ncbi:MAG: 1-(5-phosphoribosyl)-5-[(5-phosphoribosylamino)methylideneamino]imidazole-4-carboxamide isomerase [SAR202 cluster bacterium]|nr:1-(5-phosphoribosyl)-5-[(5-phosphoribosylamino)methylideneamino]imidazole-4-carboxamide isomerase [SAR202 cluster bacterium]
MEIIPAIDLRFGSVVRLYQGDYEKQTIFSDNPVEIAQMFESAGAPRLHLVDLDGAKNGSATQSEVITTITSNICIPIEIGGGIRTLPEIDHALLYPNVDRVILGTIAITDPALVVKAIEKYGPERMIVGIDAKDGQIAISGWTKTSSATATELLDQMIFSGIKRFVYTDISRDGTLSEPNYPALEKLIARAKSLGDNQIIASGGIAVIDHLRKLKEIGAEGAIVGSAIYKGTLDLNEAIKSINK